MPGPALNLDSSAQRTVQFSTEFDGDFQVNGLGKEHGYSQSADVLLGELKNKTIALADGRAIVLKRYDDGRIKINVLVPENQLGERQISVTGGAPRSVKLLSDGQKLTDQTLKMDRQKGDFIWQDLLSKLVSSTKARDSSNPPGSGVRESNVSKRSDTSSERVSGRESVMSVSENDNFIENQLDPVKGECLGEGTDSGYDRENLSQYDERSEFSRPGSIYSEISEINDSADARSEITEIARDDDIISKYSGESDERANARSNSEITETARDEVIIHENSEFMSDDTATVSADDDDIISEVLRESNEALSNSAELPDGGRAARAKTFAIDPKHHFGDSRRSEVVSPRGGLLDGERARAKTFVADIKRTGVNFNDERLETQQSELTSLRDLKQTSRKPPFDGVIDIQAKQGKTGSTEQDARVNTNEDATSLVSDSNVKPMSADDIDKLMADLHDKSGGAEGFRDVVNAAALVLQKKIPDNTSAEDFLKQQLINKSRTETEEIIGFIYGQINDAQLVHNENISQQATLDALNQLGLKPRETPDDGHCFFHALSQCNGTESSLSSDAINVRKGLIETLNGLDKKMALGLFENSEKIKNDALNALQSYLEDGSNPGSSGWGTEEHLPLAALHYQRPILVIGGGSVIILQLEEDKKGVSKEQYPITDQNDYMDKCKTFLKEDNPLVLTNAKNHWQSAELQG